MRVFRFPNCNSDYQSENIVMHRLFSLLLPLGLLALPQTAYADTKDPAAPNLAHIVEMSLADVISWFEQQNDLTVRVDDVPTHTTVRATTVNFNAPDFLIWIRQKFDVEYYQHGRTIYFSSDEDVSHRVIYLDYLAVEDVVSLLGRYELHSSSPISGQNSANNNRNEVAILAGPKAYLEIAEALIAKAEQERATPPIRVSVMRAGVRSGETRVNQSTQREPVEIAENNFQEN